MLRRGIEQKDPGKMYTKFLRKKQKVVRSRESTTSEDMSEVRFPRVHPGETSQRLEGMDGR